MAGPPKGNKYGSEREPEIPTNPPEVTLEQPEAPVVFGAVGTPPILGGMSMSTAAQAPTPAPDAELVQGASGELTAPRLARQVKPGDRVQVSKVVQQVHLEMSIVTLVYSDGSRQTLNPGDAIEVVV